MTTLNITHDSGANLRILKSLERVSFIRIHSVMLENGRDTNRTRNKILPVAVWGHSRWGEAVYADTESVYDEILKIIGKKNIKDAMHLEAHIRYAHDYFVTEDRDFLDRKQELQSKFDVKIVTPNELDTICRQ